MALVRAPPRRCPRKTDKNPTVQLFAGCVAGPLGFCRLGYCQVIAEQLRRYVVETDERPVDKMPVLAVGRAEVAHLTLIEREVL